MPFSPSERSADAQRQPGEVRDAGVQVGRGMAWNLGLQTANYVLRFAIWIVLARFLTPEEFGVLGMVLVVTGLLAVFAEFGFSAALIQRPELEDTHLSSVFWVTVGIGLILTGGVAASGPALARFYREPVLRLMTPMLATMFALSSFGIVPRALLCRRMDFRAVGLTELATTVCAGGVAIAMVAQGMGVWGLVAQSVLLAALGSAGYAAAARFRPRLRFDRRAIGDLLRFSLHLQAFNAVNYLAKNLEKALIGRFMGSGPLGLYARAFTTMQLIEYQFSYMIGNVAWPALARAQGDPAALRRMYPEFLSFVAFLVFPLLLGLLAVAEHFVAALYGPAWLQVVPVLRILCILGVFQTVIGSTGWIFLSQGRTDVQFHIGAAAAILLAVGYGVGVWVGTIEAVALCTVFSGGIVLLYPALRLAGRIADMTPRHILAAVWGPLLCSTAMALVVHVTDRVLPARSTHALRLVVETGVGAVVYFLLAHLANLGPWRRMLDRLRETGGVRGVAARWVSGRKSRGGRP